MTNRDRLMRVRDLLASGDSAAVGSEVAAVLLPVRLSDYGLWNRACARLRAVLSFDAYMAFEYASLRLHDSHRCAVEFGGNVQAMDFARWEDDQRDHA